MAKRRKPKLKTENEVGEAIDRISDLPDAILVYILGKLPTKYAVGTGVLSNRWKHLFRKIPNPDISINDSELMYRNEDIDTLTRQKNNFISFMDKLLNVTLQDIPRIRKFHLHLGGHFSQYVCKWVSEALKLNMSYLSVFDNCYKGETPESLFNCVSLVEIMLNWSVVIAVPSLVFLPNLKCLYLKHVRFHNDDLRKVLSGCPVLEELSLNQCKFRAQSTDMLVVRVFSSSVKKFEWFSCLINSEHGIEIDMPALHYFSYYNRLPEYFLVKNLNSLKKAYIDIWPIFKERGDSHLGVYMKNFANLIIGCSNVEFLSLDTPFFGAISTSFPLLQLFGNLTELVLFQNGTHKWKLLSYFLTTAPNLEILVFANGSNKYNYNGCYELFLTHIGKYPTWLAVNLQRIRFEEFYWGEDETNLLNYFLKNAKVLKKIEISCSKLGEKKLLEAELKVEDLKKISKKCQIELILGEPKKDDGDNSFGMKPF